MKINVKTFLDAIEKAVNCYLNVQNLDGTPRMIDSGELGMRQASPPSGEGRRRAEAFQQFVGVIKTLAESERPVYMMALTDSLLHSSSKVLAELVCEAIIESKGLELTDDEKIWNTRREMRGSTEADAQMVTIRTKVNAVATVTAAVKSFHRTLLSEDTKNEAVYHKAKTGYDQLINEPGIFRRAAAAFGQLVSSNKKRSVTQDPVVAQNEEMTRPKGPGTQA